MDLRTREEGKEAGGQSSVRRRSPSSLSPQQVTHALRPPHVRNVDEERRELLARAHALRGQRAAGAAFGVVLSSRGGVSVPPAVDASARRSVVVAPVLRGAHELPLKVPAQEIESAGAVAQARRVGVRRDADDARSRELSETVVL